MSPAEPDRERLFSPIVIAAFGLLVMLMLMLAFPRERLQERLLQGQKTDTLTIAYLEAWLRIAPDNAEVLTELTRQYLKAQRIADAERLLARLAVSSDEDAQARSLKVRIELAETQAYALKPDDPARAARLRELDRLLTAAAGKPWPPGELEAFAAKAAALGDAALAGRYYARLADAEPARAGEWLEASAKLALGARDYAAAADAFFAARGKAHGIDEERRLFLSGVEAWQAGNRLNEALLAADQQLGSLARDRETLRFLTRLALAAGRPDLADRYARRLIDMSARGRAEGESRREAVADKPSVGVRRAVWTPGPRDMRYGLRRIASDSAEPPSHRSAPRAAFDNDDYELAFKVFLANGNVASAQRVAQSAVDHDPDSIVWRERLAQVAEWNHAPDVALKNYAILARRRNDAASWAQVERLAPALGDDAALLEASIFEADRDPADMKRVDHVVNAYELLGDPDSALRFLKARIDRQPRGPVRRAMLERYAALAGRKGDDDLALSTYTRLNDDYGPDPKYAFRLGILYYVRTDFGRSLAVLKNARRAATPADDDFWRLYTMVASVSQDDAAAKEGYQALVQGGKASSDDMASMVGLYDDTPLEAGRLAEFAYRSTGRERLLELAVYEYTRAHATARIASLLASLDPAQRAAAERRPAFLLARAQYLRDAGDPDGALRDVRAALALAPGNAEARTALMWSLAERGSDAELRTALRRYARDAEGDGSLWGPYAAAYLRLGDGRAALHMMHKQAATRRDDPLWALGYADALELNSRIDEVWRVRNAVWRRQMTARASASPRLDDAQRADLRARMVGLTDLFRGGDASRAVLIELLREDRDPDTAAAPSPADALPASEAARIAGRQRLYSAVAREAALGWAQSHEAYDLERVWLLRQYIDSATRPVYAEMTIALAERDTPTIERLLDTEPDWVPRQNRLDAEAVIGRFGAVQTHAYEQQFALPDDETVNAVLREQLLRNAQALAPRFRVVDQGGLRFTESGIGAGIRLSPTQSLTLDYSERNQTGSESLPGVPQHDRRLDLTFRNLALDHSEKATLGRRNALDDFTTFRLEGTLRDTRSLSFSYALGVHQMATETSQLIVGGMKNLASVGFLYRPDPHVFLNGRFEYDRFYGQDESFLGTGAVYDLSAGYKLRTGYPDYTVRAVFTHGQYSASGTPGGQLLRLLPAGVPLTASQFMPQTFTQAGVLFSVGDDLDGGYTRRWRPFFAAGPVHDSNQGWVAQVRAGLAGSVFGNDQAVVYYEHAGASSGRSQPFTEYGVRYRWLY
ncbi:MULTISPECIES: tetratricopeptide repeat protein [unclassified Caballeronia]|uniref:tetratricopeptide repeat protein n=1 Tax=unclassified Caballeronia TaxID=2646786 RepID=UPI00285E3C99|nr:MULTISPECIES: tetratricopeptide repeat protein [unclassified Caballeronia]MDR5753903.1 tetratricopeptide repeat protein [Caballeronia sp. LZ024]MDR5840282.1 tetratricopeptide repeat protein [Caballeronia sp. LZ031]